MSRIRAIKPDFFRHEGLFEAEKKSALPLRVAFAGLWTVADREGRFRWRPRVIKLDVLPFDEVDFEDVLDALVDHEFIVKYQVGEEIFGHIPTFLEHQHINQRELASSLPSPDDDDACTCENIPARAEEEREGKGRERELSADADAIPEPPLLIEVNGHAAKPCEAAPKERYPAEFEELWREYQAGAQNKNSSKADAFKAWRKLGESDRESCFIGVVKYAEEVTAGRNRGSTYTPKHLETFINKRGWEPYLEKIE